MEEGCDGVARVDRGRNKKPFWVAARDSGTRGTGIEDRGERGENGENEGESGEVQIIPECGVVTGFRFFGRDESQPKFQTRTSPDTQMFRMLSRWTDIKRLSNDFRSRPFSAREADSLLGLLGPLYFVSS